MPHKKFELLIRGKAPIKSRQWWNKKIKNLFNSIPQFLNKRTFSFCKNLSFTLLITNNKEIQDLNKRFRNIKRPTDVLSFHLSKNKQISNKYLGDIVISEQFAKKEAKKNNKEVDIELQMLLVHGYLHLLGYDHILPKDRKNMFSLQNKILNNMNKNHIIQL